MDAHPTFGIAGFLAQTDTIGKLALLILIVMSLASWYLIISKTLQRLLARGHTRRFLAAFQDAPSIDAVAQMLAAAPSGEPFGRMMQQVLRARQHWERHSAQDAQPAAPPTSTVAPQRFADTGSASEFLIRAIRQALNEETAHLEGGLTVLASVGSTAPFVGLFGTVWGVYHALINIGMMGQGTLDKVAGPVGEALIMTALGLAVAIPAVLAYNAFTRNNRLLEAQLDSFAYDLHTFLTTGMQRERDGEFRNAYRDEQGVPHRAKGV